MGFDATFNTISIYGGGQFYWWRTPEYTEKTTDTTHWQKLSHGVVSNTPRLSVIRTHNVSGNMY